MALGIAEFVSEYLRNLRHDGPYSPGFLRNGVKLLAAYVLKLVDPPVRGTAIIHGMSFTKVKLLAILLLFV
jgi:hypothetical protein